MNAGTRLEYLRHVLQGRGLSGGLITSPANIRYLTPQLKIPSGHALLITSDSLQVRAPAQTGKNSLSRLVGMDRGPAGHGRDHPDPADLSAVLAAMRRVKDDDEVAAITEAAACVDRGLEAAQATMHPGVTDAALVESARTAILKSTCAPVEFAFNIGAGRAGADPEATSSGVVLAPGDAVFIDLYPRVGAYFADATRTFSTGVPQPHLDAITTALWAALDASAALLVPGARAADVDRRCRRELEARGMAADYPHHTGHGVGLEQQEPPWLTPHSRDVLMAGDVVALEPGVYSEAMGARVEELYVIRPDGPQLISHASRSLHRGGGLGT